MLRQSRPRCQAEMVTHHSSPLPLQPMTCSDQARAHLSSSLRASSLLLRLRPVAIHMWAGMHLWPASAACSRRCESPVAVELCRSSMAVLWTARRSGNRLSCKLSRCENLAAAASSLWCHRPCEQNGVRVAM